MENQVQAFLQPAARDTAKIPCRASTHSGQTPIMNQKQGFAARLKNTAQSQSFTETNRQLEDSPIYVQHPDGELRNASLTLQQMDEALQELLHRLLALDEEGFWQLALAGQPLLLDTQPSDTTSLLAAVQEALKGMPPDQVPPVLMELLSGELAPSQEEWLLILQNIYASVSEEAGAVRQTAANGASVPPPDQAAGREGAAVRMPLYNQAATTEEIEPTIKSSSEPSSPAGQRVLSTETFSARMDAAGKRVDVQQIMEQENQRMAGKRPGHALPAEQVVLVERVVTEEAPRGMIWNPAGRAEVTSLLNSEVKDLQPTSRPMLEGRELVDQVVKKMQLLQRPNLSEMRIQLKPEVLGKMMVKIMVEEGVVTARFLTDNHQVRQLLEANMGLLRQNLEASGLKVDRTEVNVALDNGRNFDQQERQQALWQQPDSQQNSASEQELQQYLFYGLGGEPEREEYLPGLEEQYGLHYGRVNFMV